MNKLTAYQIWRKYADKKITEEQYKQLLKDNSIIIKRTPKVGDKILVHGEIKAIITEIKTKGNTTRYYFRDDINRKWCVKRKAFKLIK